jgi:hypothetical protein
VSEPRILTDEELDEIEATGGCSFGEAGERGEGYYIADLLYSAKVARMALRALSLNGSMDTPLWSWCDDGWLCQHPECRQGRYALGHSIGNEWPA